MWMYARRADAALAPRLCDAEHGDVPALAALVLVELAHDAPDGLALALRVRLPHA
jgi:hypothetical protein